MSELTIEVSYGQLCVFDPSLPTPFNDWADEHIAQGFAWRPQSISFATLDGGGPIQLQVLIGPPGDLSASEASRIIAVPFHMVGDGGVEIASISSGLPMKLAQGHYEVIFEHGRDEARGMWGNLCFSPTVAPSVPRLLRVDPNLSPPAELVMTANPA